MSKEPLISVIVAVYNGGETLQRCIDRFAMQSYPNKELIIMDGGSTDNTKAILEASNTVITYWESVPDKGIYHAWNKALAKAKGDWICFLGSDDYYWSEDVLENMVQTIGDLSPAIRLVYGRVAIVMKSGKVIQYVGQSWEEAQINFKRFMTIPHPGLLHRRSLFEEHGVFDDTLRLAGDYDLLLRELKSGTALYIPDLVTIGMQHGGVSNNPAAMGRYYKELVQVHARHFSPWAIAWRFSSVNVKMAACALTVLLIGDGGFRTVADLIRRVMGRPPIWTKELE